MNLKDRLETIDLILRLLEKSKFSVFNGEYSDYQKELILCETALKQLIEDYSQNLMEPVKID